MKDIISNNNSEISLQINESVDSDSLVQQLTEMPYEEFTKLIESTASSFNQGVKRFKYAIGLAVTALRTRFPNNQEYGKELEALQIMIAPFLDGEPTTRTLYTWSQLTQYWSFTEFKNHNLKQLYYGTRDDFGMELCRELLLQKKSTEAFQSTLDCIYLNPEYYVGLYGLVLDPTKLALVHQTDSTDADKPVKKKKKTKKFIPPVLLTGEPQDSSVVSTQTQQEEHAGVVIDPLDIVEQTELGRELIIMIKTELIEEATNAAMKIMMEQMEAEQPVPESEAIIARVDALTAKILNSLDALGISISNKIDDHFKHTGISKNQSEAVGKIVKISLEDMKNQIH